MTKIIGYEVSMFANVLQWFRFNSRQTTNNKTYASLPFSKLRVRQAQEPPALHTPNIVMGSSTRFGAISKMLSPILNPRLIKAEAIFADSDNSSE